jgi:hypothetical protein
VRDIHSPPQRLSVQKMFDADPDWQEAERLGYPSAATATAIASAKQGAGDKAEGKVGSNAHELFIQLFRREVVCGRFSLSFGKLFLLLRETQGSPLLLGGGSVSTALVLL